EKSPRTPSRLSRRGRRALVTRRARGEAPRSGDCRCLHEDAGGPIGAARECHFARRAPGRRVGQETIFRRRVIRRRGPRHLWWRIALWTRVTPGRETPPNCREDPLDAAAATD